jgi:hypothetical protein
MVQNLREIDDRYGGRENYFTKIKIPHHLISSDKLER